MTNCIECGGWKNCGASECPMPRYGGRRHPVTEVLDNAKAKSPDEVVVVTLKEGEIRVHSSGGEPETVLGMLHKAVPGFDPAKHRPPEKAH